MPIRFLYFDLGKVLVDFEVEQMVGQMAEAARVQPEAVRAVLLDAGLQAAIETGRIAPRLFYEEFCRQTGAACSLDELVHAASAIFLPKAEMLPLLAALRESNTIPRGILSNTCGPHWDYCKRQFPDLVGSFSVFALSYEIGAMKPEAQIYRAAAELAGVSPEEIFFVDDVAQNVDGARAVGIDAVLFTGAARLAEELRNRGVAVDM